MTLALIFKHQIPIKQEHSDLHEIPYTLSMLFERCMCRVPDCPRCFQAKSFLPCLYDLTSECSVTLIRATVWWGTKNEPTKPSKRNFFNHRSTVSNCHCYRRLAHNLLENVVDLFWIRLKACLNLVAIDAAVITFWCRPYFAIRVMINWRSRDHDPSYHSPFSPPFCR